MTADPLDIISGPHLEASVTETYTLRAGDLWRVLELAKEGGEVRVKFDWNGVINSRAWDMSYVQWNPEPYRRING